MSNLKNLTIFFTILIVITVTLMYTNITVQNNISLKSIPVTKNVKVIENLSKRYGYSDMLSLIVENKNLELLNISDTKTQKEIVNVDIKFNCEKDKLTSILNYVTTKDNFKNLNSITITAENKLENEERSRLEGIINVDFIKSDKK